MTKKIRPLKVSDRKRLSGMIQKLTEVMGDESLLNAISSLNTTAVGGAGSEGEGSEGDGAVANVGLKIIKMLLQTLEDETQEWFADLLGVTPAEFLGLPFNTEMDVIEQIVQAEESSAFFTIASRLFKKTAPWLEKLSELRG